MAKKLKLGLLTSWNTKCGIAEYSQYLVKAFQKRDDIDVTVFGSKNYGDYKVGEDPSFVIPTFGVPPWNGNTDASFDIQNILTADIDVLHIQYEVVLYNQPNLYKLLNTFDKPIAITYHDNCIDYQLPFHRFKLQYSHREDVGVGDGYLLPMGIENRTPIVKTFGLGRSRKDIIEAICDRNGWEFQYSFGEDTWIDQESLYLWLRDADAIVLWYDEVPSAGASIAARVALSTRRPLIVSRTTWFKGLEDSRVNYVDTPEILELYLQALLYDEYIEQCSWDYIADTLIEDYRSL